MEPPTLSSPTMQNQELHEDPVPSQIANTPPLSIGNDPLITPLTILDFKTSTTDGTPTRYALV
ncbi:hypothetical protein GmHk_15G044906 [Glycine max]|nr:hypothetical protein GmHk_15G044906 [Glycine max]